MNGGAQPEGRAGTCARCETVSHCIRHGCVPITTADPPPLAPTKREQDMAALIGVLASHLCSPAPRCAMDSALAADAFESLRRWGLSARVPQSAPATGPVLCPNGEPWDENPDGIVSGQESGPRMCRRTGMWEVPDDEGEEGCTC